MRKETDLDGVKAIAKALLMTSVNQTPYSPMIVQHPFTSTGLIPFPTEMNKGFQPVDITLNEDNLKIWRESISQIIDEAENPYHIYMLLNPPYALTFLKLASPYDLLINENNDPVHDPKPLRVYMDKWDGQAFIEKMKLDKGKTVLEIGIGTGRLAIRTAPKCREFFGIDISPKTIEKTTENLAEYDNVSLICDDFLTHQFNRDFDVIYSSLTFMHIEEKQKAINKVAALLKDGGRFVLSIDKNQSDTIDYGTRKIKIYPDNKEDIVKYITQSGMNLMKVFETDFAFVFIAEMKQNNS